MQNFEAFTKFSLNEYYMLNSLLASRFYYKRKLRNLPLCSDQRK